VIASYRDKRTRDFAAGKRVKAFSGIQRMARLKLDRLEAAVNLRDLAVLPGNRFEGLKGDRAGQYAFASTISGGSVSSGRKTHPVHPALKLSTITRRKNGADGNSPR